MRNKKTFLIASVLALCLAMGVATAVLSSQKPEMHKSFMLEIINVKIKK